MIIPAPNEIAFSLFGFSVYWYGIILAIAIFTGTICANTLFNKINPNYRADIIVESGTLIIILGVIFARLYYCFINYEYYFHHIGEILYFREGGLSIHGGIIGGIISVIIMHKHYKIPFMNIIDPIACSALLGQAIGRWGNYFNSEAYGYPIASQNWGLYIPQSKRVAEYANMQFFHPTFLYESFLDLFVFFILLFIYFKFGKKIKGLTFFAYITFYSIIRFFVEKIRVDSVVSVGNMPFPEFISIILFIIGVIGIIFSVVLSSKNNSCN